jgi:hypothetical protein
VCLEHFLLGEPLVAALGDAGRGVTWAPSTILRPPRALAHLPDALTTGGPPNGLAGELLEGRLLGA